MRRNRPAVLGPPIRAPITTSRPPRAAIRIVVRSVAPQVDCLVVVIEWSLLRVEGVVEVCGECPNSPIGGIPLRSLGCPLVFGHDLAGDRARACRPRAVPSPDPGAAAAAAAGGPDRGDGEGGPLQPAAAPPRLDRRGRRDRGGGA